jgi:hypothetical protein
MLTVSNEKITLKWTGKDLEESNRNLVSSHLHVSSGQMYERSQSIQKEFQPKSNSGAFRVRGRHSEALRKPRNELTVSGPRWHMFWTLRGPVSHSWLPYHCTNSLQNNIHLLWGESKQTKRQSRRIHNSWPPPVHCLFLFWCLVPVAVLLAYFFFLVMTGKRVLLRGLIITYTKYSESK